ncbi:tRNA (guanosine(37)-N1)-methyltransferase TrmD [Bacteriovoracaceae bacterium]|nr:tRNA (guanosine(37)-N1)-methyltransferase TrmD [Bacteriovoracaceae bacterium]
MSRKIWIMTLFPEYFHALKSAGVVARSFEGESRIELNLVQIREFSKNNYKGVDDAPYGGGPGMVMRADVLADAFWQGIVGPGGYGKTLSEVKKRLTVIFPTPIGKVWSAPMAEEWAEQLSTSEKDLVFLCGRYEGVDQRFIDRYVDVEVSLGDYILSGGEIAVVTMLDSMLRFRVLGNQRSLGEESFSNTLDGGLEGPQYTRPRVFEDMQVPDVLVSGHQKKIKEFQQKQGRILTANRRPDLRNKNVS